MVSKNTLYTDIWQFLYNLLNSDTDITNEVNGIYSAYPRVFIDDAGGLPFIVINKPVITEEGITFKDVEEKFIEVEIEIIVGGESESAKKLKHIMDLIQKRFDSSVDDFQSEKLFNPKIVSDTPDYDYRKGKKIYYGIIRLSFTYNGD